jgi:cytosine/adenosine deaminase-related metal-dependent hydrolase
MPTLEELAKLSTWGNGRVTLGFAFDGFPYLPKEYLDQLMAKLAEYKIPLIQTHISWKPGRPSMPKMLDKKGILDNRWLMAHSNMTKSDADLYRERGIHYSSTPSTEMQMGLVFPVACFRDDLGVKDLGSFGVDCHTNNSSFIPGEARIGLQGARAARAEVSKPAKWKYSL